MRARLGARPEIALIELESSVALQDRTRADAGRLECNSGTGHACTRTVPTETAEVELVLRPRAVWRVCGQVLLVAGAVYLLSRIMFALGWVLIALVLALALEPAILWLERHKLRRGLAILLVMGSVVALLVALAATMVPLLIEQVQAHIETAPTWIDRLRGSKELAWANVHLGLLDALKREIAGAASAAAGSAVALASSVMYGLAGTLTVVALTVFMLLFGPGLIRAVLEWINPAKRSQLVEVATQIQKSVGGFVAGSLVIATIGGFVTAIAMIVVGVPYYLPLGLLMVLLGLIPYVGSFIGGVLVTGTAFLAVGLAPAIKVAVVFIVYQQVENQLLQPLVQRHTIKMNPLLIALAMLVGTASAGVIGAVLTLPIAGALQVVAQGALARRKLRWESSVSTAKDSTAGVDVGEVQAVHPAPTSPG